MFGGDLPVMHFNRKPIDLKTIGQLVAQGVGKMLNSKCGRNSMEGCCLRMDLNLNFSSCLLVMPAEGAASGRLVSFVERDFILTLTTENLIEPSKLVLYDAGIR
ncbi:hypothetical protein PAECIP111893_03086 [Paenibacillus plantiphilus]|uniref:Uncharacterized protein n=1 Tax=Paenibacillus plantiphilus TaxID=2905650 RepID=A0ABM9CD55_9BACL|nr:hypothetical protein [Paenibacillus plantiphilus]CAH1209649.1 hypothetical protein PAECIP111893_03086 [Paenibacillus plantiphilus]